MGHVQKRCSHSISAGTRDECNAAMKTTLEDDGKHKIVLGVHSVETLVQFINDIDDSEHNINSFTKFNKFSKELTRNYF